MTPRAELLTTDEVAARFRVTRQTVARWAGEGLLDPVRMKRTVRYRLSDIEALLNPEAA